MRRLATVLGVLAVGALLWGMRASALGDHLTLEGMRGLVGAHGPYGPLVFIGACAAGMILHAPPLPLVAFAGVLFEGQRAFAYAWVASLVGATVIFLVARATARERIQRALRARFARVQMLDDRLERRGFSTVVVLRLLLFLAPPLTWALAASRVRVRHYLAGTAVGVVPGIALAVLVGGSVADSGASGGEIAARVAAAGLLLGALALAGTLVARRILDRQG